MKYRHPHSRHRPRPRLQVRCLEERRTEMFS